MTMPVRIQLSRRKGFNLQEVSKALNGLPAVNVARPSVFGNPFPLSDAAAYLDDVKDAGLHGPGETAHVIAVRWFEEWLAGGLLADVGRRPPSADHIAALRGKNLGCWCAPDATCHADVLLRLANVRCDEPSSTPSAESGAPEDHPRSPLAEAPSTGEQK
ncbi:DUF4326 domain-containing protein [Methylobacterium fujisawaense]|uniref:DUF4326 domain-containing protein n=1 Tax=Methylobacterium fujisawaense TaxID=107400 RepID=UPI00313E7CE1